MKTQLELLICSTWGEPVDNLMVFSEVVVLCCHFSLLQ